MPINNRFAVAVHSLAVLGFLKNRGVDRVTSQLIAQSVNTNPVVIRGLLKKLKAAGLVVSKEGKDGGVSLARSATKISLDEVFAAVEDQSVLKPNPKPELKACPVSCAMKKIIPALCQDVDRAVMTALKKHTLKQIIDSLKH